MEYETISMSAHVEIEGHVAGIALRGKGFGRGAIGPSVNAIFEVKGNMRQQKGIEFYNTKNVKVNLSISHGSYYVEELFDNNELLVRMANEMLNANSVMVSEALIPFFERLAEMGVMRFMKTLTRIPYRELFPQSR
ncbi:hypothetical protein ILUMI_16719 [Ignelater luminosus]|uniref:Uncharacterized protein n=1 Tax=Ignelater luminosus TaxID=2038154 RepID=A0A8K0G7Y6_IGNLU|nr:hypothetical protein ILUMI_16719 [Ignelater luminosus]